MLKKKNQHHSPITLDVLARKVDALGETTTRQIEQLAQSSEREFEVIRSEMATKGELKEVLHAIETMDTHFSATASEWSEDFEGLRRITKDHEERLRLLEKRHLAS